MYASDPSGYDPAKEFLKVRANLLDAEEILGFFIVSLPKLSSAWVSISRMRLGVFRTGKDPMFLPMTSVEAVTESKRFITTEFSLVLKDSSQFVVGGLYSVDVSKFRDILALCIESAIPVAGLPLGKTDLASNEAPRSSIANQEPDLLEKVQAIEAEAAELAEKKRKIQDVEAEEASRRLEEKNLKLAAKEALRAEKAELKAKKIELRQRAREDKLTELKAREDELEAKRATEAADQEPFRQIPINTSWDDLHKRVKAALLENLAEGEMPSLIVDCGREGSLVGLRDRLLVLKYGYHSGALGGSRVATMYYTEITGIEFNSGFLNGVLEILTPSYDGSANKDFWQGQEFLGPGADKNSDANDPRTLSNTIPMMKSEYQAAKPLLDKLRGLIRGAKSGSSTSSGTQGSVADEIAKLAELLKQGLITEAEFEVSKKKLI